MDHDLFKKEFKYMCDICSKIFANKGNLAVHIKTHSCSKPASFFCSSCDKIFSKKFNLTRHVKTCDGLKKAPHYHCSICQFKTVKKVLLHQHFANVHQINLTEQIIEFLTYEEFIEWKKSLQKKSNTKFVMSRTAYKTIDGATQHQFACFRSGFYHPDGKGLRCLKETGSNKINGYCPSKMLASVMPSGQCSVKYISTHVGHDNEIERVTLSKERKCKHKRRGKLKIKSYEVLDINPDDEGSFEIIVEEGIINEANNDAVYNKDANYNENVQNILATLKLNYSDMGLATPQESLKNRIRTFESHIEKVISLIKHHEQLDAVMAHAANFEAIIEAATPRTVKTEVKEVEMAQNNYTLLLIDDPGSQL